MAILDIFRPHRRDASDASQDAPSNATTVPWKIAAEGGVDVVSSREMALRIATVYRCADILSKGVAQLPLIIKEDKGGYFAETTDDAFGISPLIKWKPNERQTAFELKRTMMLQILFSGNAVLVPVLEGPKYRRLVLTSPNSTSYDPYRNVYIVNDTINGINGTYPAEEVIHIKNLSTDGGYWGQSTLQYASKVLAISANADKENVRNFKNGGLIKGFVSGKNGATVGFGAIQDSQLDATAKKVTDQIKNGSDIFSLPGEMSFSQLSLSPKDLELLSTKQFNVLEICRFFGVHPDKVFAQQSTNYKASEMSQVSFLTDTLQPYLTQIENEFQVKMVPLSMIDRYRIDFDIEPLMQTDLTTQADYMTKTLAAGVRSVNDWRRKLGQAPIPGGDSPLVSANLILLGSAKSADKETE